MVTEIALIDIVAGQETDFIAAVESTIGAIQSAPGAEFAQLKRCIEEPTRFALEVQWRDVAAHDAFRGTEAFAAWRAAVGPHLAGPPAAAHYELV